VQSSSLAWRDSEGRPPLNDLLLLELKKLPRHLQFDYLFWNRHRGEKRYVDTGGKAEDREAAN
jgi:hypothetical protein